MEPRPPTVSKDEASPRKKKGVTGYYEVEVSNEKQRTLHIYGDAFDCLDSAKIVASSTNLVCRFVSGDRIIEKVKPHAKLFAKLTSVTLAENAIQNLSQVASLLAVFTSAPLVKDLAITANPVCSMTLLRPFVATMAPPKLQSFNGDPLTDEERASHAASLRCASTTDVKHKSIARRAVDRAVQAALVNDHRRHHFETAFPAALHSYVLPIFHDLLPPQARRRRPQPRYRFLLQRLLRLVTLSILMVISVVPLL